MGIKTGKPLETLAVVEDGFVCILPRKGQNKGVMSVQPDMSNSPPDCCIYLFKSLPLRKTKQPTPKGVSCFVVGEDGFEPSKRYAADLQSVPFGHSGTPPYLVCLSKLCMEPVDGLEPPTC